MSSKNVGSKQISDSVDLQMEKLPNLPNDKLKERLLLPRMINFSVILSNLLSFHLIQLKKESHSIIPSHHSQQNCQYSFFHFINFKWSNKFKTNVCYIYECFQGTESMLRLCNF